MFLESYKKALAVLAKKPMVLWGLSLMSGLITSLTMIFLGLIPALAFAVVYLISCGMTKVYLDGLEGKAVYADQLFAGFGKNCFRIAGGMAWMQLWILIWALVPIVGPIIAMVKAYSYRFVPYLLINQPEVTATQALKISMQLTDGIKGQMFLADLCFVGGVWVVTFVLGLLSAIPVLGVLFMIVSFIFTLAVGVFGSVFTGLYQAYFYAQQVPSVTDDAAVEVDVEA